MLESIEKSGGQNGALQINEFSFFFSNNVLTFSQQKKTLSRQNSAASGIKI